MERAPLGGSAFDVVAELPANAESFVDVGLACDTAYDYVVTARGCGGSAAASAALGTVGCPELSADKPAASLSFGGTQALSLDAGPDRAGFFHLLLGSASGTALGLTGPVLNLPLNYDGYLVLTLVSPNQGALGNTFGWLDSEGQATSTFSLPPGASPWLAGKALHHSFVAFDPGELLVKYASNPVSVLLAP